jgi:hypothetical protein
MFNFLNSAVLIAAAAALIPLLIHLFSRRKVRVVPFSSLKYLKEMQKRQVRRIKIRQLLLLMLRMLIILVAVLAFARPATRGGYIGSHAGVSSVILFDHSASMQRQVKDGLLHELSCRKIKEILSSFGQSDEVLLIPFDRDVSLPFGEGLYSADVAKEILGESGPGYDRADLGKAFRKGQELLGAASSLNKEMYLISDRQLNSLPDSAGIPSDDISYYLIDLPIEIDGNCGITGINMGGQLIEVGSDFNIKATIKNYDSRPKSEQLASLFVDGTCVMQKEFEIAAEDQQSVQLSYEVMNSGFHSGWIEISDDDFLPDNRHYFSFRIPERFNILIIDDDGGGEIVRLALVPSEEIARHWSVKKTDSQNLASIDFRDYDLVILSGPASTGSAETRRLFEFVDAGGGLLFILGEKTDRGYFNREFGQKLKVEMSSPVPEYISGAGYFTLERLDYGHPIFEPFAEMHKNEMPILKFYGLANMRGNPEEHNLGYFSNGNPALIEAGFGLGKIIILGSPILPRFTDLAGHSFFVPFIIRTAEYLATDVSSYDGGNIIGQNIIRTVSDKTSLQSVIEMITPENRIFQLTGIQKPGQVAFDCRPVDIPGIYQLVSGNHPIDIFAANLSPDEGNLQAASPEQLAASLGIKQYKTIPFNSNTDKFISEARYGRELWQIFLWAVVILLVVEMIFSREKSAAVE